MKSVSLLPDITIENQIDFIEDFDKFVSNAVYGYLFEGLTLREIESKYLGLESTGFFARTVLQGVGIDTSRKVEGNKGIYDKSELDNIIRYLISDSDPRLNNIGRLIEKK